MKKFNYNPQTAEAILELNSLFSDLDNFKEFPALLETVLRKYLPVDWLSMYQASLDSNITINTSPSLPCNWEELYKEIAHLDRFREESLSLRPGEALRYSERQDPYDEVENFCHEFARKHTDVVDFITTATINTTDNHFIFGFYSTDQNQIFTESNKTFIEQISPVLISASNLMMFYKHFDFQRVAFDHMIKTLDYKYIILDRNVNIVDLPSETIDFFKNIFNDKNLNGLPTRIKEYINEKISAARVEGIHRGPIVKKLALPKGALVIYTYQIEKYYLMKFIFQQYDIQNTQTLPLTNMENKVLQFFKKGLIVKEIAYQLNLSERGVNFHKYNIVKKLNASNITQAVSVLKDLGL